MLKDLLHREGQLVNAHKFFYSGCSEEFGNHKGKKHSSDFLTHTGASDNYVASTDLLKKKRKKPSDQTGNQVKNILNLSSRSDFFLC